MIGEVKKEDHGRRVGASYIDHRLAIEGNVYDLGFQNHHIEKP